jgi:hypothetical protein
MDKMHARAKGDCMLYALCVHSYHSAMCTHLTSASTCTSKEIPSLYWHSTLPVWTVPFIPLMHALLFSSLL